MRTSAPRAVLVTRPSDFERVLARHATYEQARFFLRTRGQSIERLQLQHQRLVEAVTTVQGAIPVEWRRASVKREDLDRFLFEPGDVVVAVGQDGLVANLAKYLDGQIVIGVNPDRERYDGLLVPCSPDEAAGLLPRAAAGDVALQQRTMARAELEDGQRLLALNEVFVGHASHQSARYRLRWEERAERQCSSGVIVCTGTGATGWARSICRERGDLVELPGPEESALAFLVREAFPSVSTGTSLTGGSLATGARLELVSEMDGGVIFGDGIEADRLRFRWGQTVSVSVARERLNLAILG